MGHIIIVGATETGKSRLAKRLCDVRSKTRDYQQTAHIVLDPLAADWGEGVEVVETFAELHAAIIDYHAEKIPLCVYVDEADNFLSMRQPENHWLLLRGRHFGVSVTVITQRPALVAPSVRGMCGTAHIFRISASDAKLLANDYALESIAQRAPALAQGQWLHVRWENGQKTLDTFTFPA